MEEDYKTPKFFERSKSKTKQQEPIYKLVELQKLTAYWNTHDSLQLSATNSSSSEDAKKMKRFMMEIVDGKRPVEQLLQVNLQAKITINLDNMNYKKPELEASLEIDEFKAHISNKQLQDLVKLIEIFNDYNQAVD